MDSCREWIWRLSKQDLEWVLQGRKQRPRKGWMEGVWKAINRREERMEYMKQRKYSWTEMD